MNIFLFSDLMEINIRFQVCLFLYFVWSSFRSFVQINSCRFICLHYPLITAGLHLHRLNKLLKSISLYRDMFSAEPATKLLKWWGVFSEYSLKVLPMFDLPISVKQQIFKNTLGIVFGKSAVILQLWLTRPVSHVLMPVFCLPVADVLTWGFTNYLCAAVTAWLILWAAEQLQLTLVKKNI